MQAQSVPTLFMVQQGVGGDVLTPVILIPYVIHMIVTRFDSR